MSPATDQDPGQDPGPDPDDLVTASISWLAFLRAPRIPLTAWEHD
jgi:hypothetical protein